MTVAEEFNPADKLDMAAAMMAAAINPVTPVGNPTKMKRGKRVSASLKIVVPSAIMDGL